MATAMALLCSSRTVFSLFLGCADGKTSQTWPLNQNCLPREGGGSPWNGHSPGSCSDRESKAGPALRDGLSQGHPELLPNPKGAGFSSRGTSRWVWAQGWHWYDFNCCFKQCDSSWPPVLRSRLSEISGWWLIEGPCTKKVLINLKLLRVLDSLPAVPRFRKTSLAPNSRLAVFAEPQLSSVCEPPGFSCPSQLRVVPLDSGCLWTLL